MVIEVDPVCKEVDEAVRLLQAGPGEVVRLDLREARAVHLLCVLEGVGGREGEHGGQFAEGVSQAVVGLVPPEEEAAAADGGVVLGVGSTLAGGDEDNGERHAEEEGELHAEVEVVLDDEGNALSRVGSARRGEPHGVIVLAVHTGVVGEKCVPVGMARERTVRVHLRAAHNCLIRQKLEYAGPMVEEDVRPEIIIVVRSIVFE